MPGPHDPATTPQPAGLAGALARIEPARTTTAFTLDPTAAGPAGTPASEVGATSSTASSAAYHDTDPAPDGRNSASGTGKAQQPREGVVKTMLRAAAERWRKGADIHLKRLDVQKARHQAAQVKETRQVSVNNSPAPSPRGTQNSSGMGTGKSGGKTNSGGPGKAPKNSNGAVRDTGNGVGRKPGSTGSGSGGRGKDTPGAGRGRTDSGPGKAPAGDRRDTKAGGGGAGTKPSTPGADRGKTNGAGGPGTATAKEGKAGKEGKPGKEAPNPAGTGKDTASPKNTATPKPGGTGGADTKTADTTGKRKTPAADHDAKKPASSVDLTKKTSKDAPNTAPGKDAAKDTGPKPAPGTDSAGKADKPGTDTAKTTGTTPAGATGSTPARTEHPPRTQTSRETGYRDGNRAARLVAHVEAYRDGARDGWDDGRKTTAHDKTRLDTARADRLKHREDPAVTGPQPIPVHNINDSHVTLPGGQTHTRGEIRTVKDYERNLTEKATSLHKAAEATRSLKQHAEEQAAAAATLTEQARTVEGGDKLISALARLHEQAAIQAGLADSLHGRATRSAESTNTLLANVATRYSGIYKAVCDSETTQPAKLFWYRDGAPTHA
jgi:hypothetical protein